KSHDQARGLKTDRVPIIFINKYFTQFIPGKQEGYATTTQSLPLASPSGQDAHIVPLKVKFSFGNQQDVWNSVQSLLRP
ncbi:hypothetical protein, partial [Microcystis aeruginosa]